MSIKWKTVSEKWSPEYPLHAVFHTGDYVGFSAQLLRFPVSCYFIIFLFFFKKKKQKIKIEQYC